MDYFWLNIFFLVFLFAGFALKVVLYKLRILNSQFNLAKGPKVWTILRKIEDPLTLKLEICNMEEHDLRVLFTTKSETNSHETALKMPLSSQS